LWQNFPTWQKEKKEKKKGTTKALNKFFPMHITDRCLFYFCGKISPFGKRKKRKRKRKGHYKSPKLIFWEKNPPNSSGFKEFCFLNLSDLDDRS
jgi:hypothetical protein